MRMSSRVLAVHPSMHFAARHAASLPLVELDSDYSGSVLSPQFSRASRSSQVAIPSLRKSVRSFGHGIAIGCKSICTAGTVYTVR